MLFSDTIFEKVDVIISPLRIDRQRRQARCLRQSCENICVLYRLARGSFDEVIQARDHQETPGAVIHQRINQAGVAAVGPLRMRRLVYYMHKWLARVVLGVQRANLLRCRKSAHLILLQVGIAGRQDTTRHGYQVRYKVRRSPPAKDAASSSCVISARWRCPVRLYALTSSLASA